MWRIIVAVILGYAVTGMLIFGTDKIFAFAISGFAEMHTLPTFYFAISLCTDTLYSIAGGWTCAAVARYAARQAVIALIVLGELFGLAATIAGWATVPHYFSLALMVIYPPAVWFGGSLRKQVRAQAAGLFQSGLRRHFRISA